MPNFLEMLRLRNIFGQAPISAPGIAGGDFMPEIQAPDLYKPRQDPFGNISFGAQNIDIPAPPPTPTPQEGFDVGQRMRELYTPETGATERFNRMVGEMPRLQEYKPSVLRSIGAALADIGGGREAGQEFLYRPHTERMMDWKTQIGPAHQAASLERQSNINERTLAYQTVSQELRQRADEARIQKDEARTKIMQDRADVYRLKSLKPNFRFDFSGPEVLVADPTTGKVERTGISTGSLSDADKMALQQEQAMERIGETGRQARITEGVRQEGRETLQDMRGWSPPTMIDDPNDPTKKIAVSIHGASGEVKRITLDNKPVTGLTRPTTGGRGPGGETPAALKVRQFNTAREFKQRNPQLGKWIKLSSGNTFDITQPGRFTGPSQEEYNQIIQHIYGAGEIPIQQPGRTGATPQGVRVIDPKTGKSGTFTGTAEQAKKAGFTVIG